MNTLPAYERVKGIHPGVILKREIKKRHLKSIELANMIGTHPQTINAITKERRGINPKLSIKLGQYFDIDQDYFMLLQASYEVAHALRSEQFEVHPLQGKFRASIFWDTKLENIDITKNKRYVIQRVLERGSFTEINELIKIYGSAIIKAEIENIESSFVPNYARNIKRYINP